MVTLTPSDPRAATAARRPSRPRPPSLLVLLGLLVAATSLLPLGYVIWSTAELGPGEAYDFLTRPRMGDLLLSLIHI